MAMQAMTITESNSQMQQKLERTKHTLLLVDRLVKSAEEELVAELLHEKNPAVGSAWIALSNAEAILQKAQDLVVDCFGVLALQELQS